MTSSLFVKPNQEYPLFITASTTLTDTTYTTVISTSTASSLTLPNSADCYEGYKITVRNSGTVSLIVSVVGTDTLVPGPSSISIAASSSMAFMCYPVSLTWYQIQ